MSNYPASLDDATTLPTTRVDATVQASNHASDHDNLAGATRALEAKVGVGSSTPVNVGDVLTVTSSGASAFQPPATSGTTPGTSYLTELFGMLNRESIP